MRRRFLRISGFKLSTAAALLIYSASAHAATQGTPGPTSTGTITINASITPEVNISGLNDITFDATRLITALNTQADATVSDQICVWSNLPDGSFYITATGDGAANSFRLNDGTRTIEYYPFISDSVGKSEALNAGIKSSQFTGLADFPDCSGLGFGDVTLDIVLLAADIATMEATTTYTGVLTLLVSPS